MALPTAATPGYGYLYTYTSHPNVGCNCVRAWVPELFRAAYKRGLVSSPTPRVMQATGMASASALVHSRGMMLDLPFPDLPRWHDPARRDYLVLGPKTLGFLYLVKEMGGFGWPRFDVDGRWDGDVWEGNPHMHLGLVGCPHGHSQAYDQLAAYKARLSGLASGGRDPYPRPSVMRTWQQGITWAKTNGEEDDMFTDQDREDLQYANKQNRAIAEAILALRNLLVKMLNDEDAENDAQYAALRALLEGQDVEDIWGRRVIRKEGNVPAIQELADIKTMLLEARDKGKL